MSDITSAYPFLHWLFSYDSTFIKQGALITYPRLFDKWNVSTLLVSEWICYNIVIITDFPNEFDAILSKSTKEWTELELIPFTLIKYSNFLQINNALSNPEVDLIIFDDVRMLSVISSALNFDYICPKIIVLSTQGDSRCDIQLVSNILPNLSLLSFDLFNKPEDINWNLISLPTTSSGICIDNKPIDEAILSSVIDGIISNWPSKQVIFTSSNISQLVDTLSLMSHTNSNPYEINDLYFISSIDDHQYNLSVYNKFLSNNTGLLITNSIPTITLSQVNIIHIVDTCNYRVIKAILDKCHKNTLSEIYVHHNNDVHTWNNLIDTLNDCDKVYHLLVDQSQRIFLYNGLYVK